MVTLERLSSVCTLLAVKNHSQDRVPRDLLISTIPLMLLTNRYHIGSEDCIQQSGPCVPYFGQGLCSSTLGHFSFSVCAAGVNTGISSDDI